MKKFLSILILIFLIPMVMLKAENKEKSVVGLWLSDSGNVKFKVYEKDGRIHGSIYWIKKVNVEGQTMIDSKNPNPDLRTKNVVGMEVLKGFEYIGDNKYRDGTIYDPESGKTYKCLINLEGDVAKVRGYVGIPLLGKTVECKRIFE